MTRRDTVRAWKLPIVQEATEERPIESDVSTSARRVRVIFTEITPRLLYAACIIIIFFCFSLFHIYIGYCQDWEYLGFLILEFNFFYFSRVLV